MSHFEGMGPQEELFFTIERLKSIAKSRSTQIDENLYERSFPIECLCGKEDQKEKENYIPIFVEHSNERMLFSVCPKCNPLESCLRCQGKGHVIRSNQFGLEELAQCDCIQTRKITEQLNSANIPTRYLTAHLKSPVTQNLSYLGFDKRTLEIYENAKSKVENFCEQASLCFRSKSQKLHSKLYSNRKPILMDKPFLILMGGVGTGKTYLACGALKHLITSSYTGILTEEERKPLDLYNVSGRFVDFTKLLMELRDCFSSKSLESELSLMNPLMKTDVLVLDEFGKVRPDNTWQLEKLDDIINARYNNNRVTILTTNYLTTLQDIMGRSGGISASTPSDFEDFWQTTLSQRIGQRMFDRLLECSIFVSFVGLPSIRRQNAERRLTSNPSFKKTDQSSRIDPYR